MQKADTQKLFGTQPASSTCAGKCSPRLASAEMSRLELMSFFGMTTVKPCKDQGSSSLYELSFPESNCRLPYLGKGKLHASLGENTIAQNALRLS